MGQLGALPTAELPQARAALPQALPAAQDQAAASFSRSFHPCAQAASPSWHRGPSHQQGTIPIAPGQSTLPGAELQGPFHSPAAPTTAVCWLHACEWLRRVFLQQERSLTLLQLEAAGLSVGSVPSPVHPVAFLCWPYNKGSQRPRALIKTRY